MKDYGVIAKPLTLLLRKKQFQWHEGATIAFQQSKKAMISTPVLALPDFSQPFTVETDASDVGLGAMLMQKGQPIAFSSKALVEKNRHLSIYEK